MSQLTTIDFSGCSSMVGVPRRHHVCQPAIVIIFIIIIVIIIIIIITVIIMSCVFMYVCVCESE